jgi:membrane associated rhomboid family serine protease
MYGRRQSGGYPEVTPMVKRLLIANVAVYLIQMYCWANAIPFDAVFAVSVEGMLRGMLWQPFTYMWLHGGLFHLAINMFVLWMFGGTLEAVWGSRRFLRFYLICGVGAGFIILFWNSLMSEPIVYTLGASGAIYGLLAAFGLLWPERTILLFPIPIPIKAIWLLPILFLMQLMLGGAQSISHAGHLGGALIAVFMLRSQLNNALGAMNFKGLRYRWHRYKMRHRLRAVRRDDWDRKRRDQDDDDRPTFH